MSGGGEMLWSLDSEFGYIAKLNDRNVSNSLLSQVQGIAYGTQTLRPACQACHSPLPYKLMRVVFA